MKKVQFTETVLRDANQSLIATRLPYDVYEPILSKIDQAGYYAVECWGGATFDVCLRYLNEDPWERLRKLRAKLPNSKLQMLLRGQNILGYKHYPDDVVRKFVEYSVKDGIDIIRIVDALNDITNMKVAIEETIKYTKERVQFGRRISQFQNTQFQLADMYAKTEAAKWPVYSAAMKKQNHEPYLGGGVGKRKTAPWTVRQWRALPTMTIWPRWRRRWQVSLALGGSLAVDRPIYTP